MLKSLAQHTTHLFIAYSLPVLDSLLIGSRCLFGFACNSLVLFNSYIILYLLTTLKCLAQYTTRLFIAYSIAVLHSLLIGSRCLVSFVYKQDLQTKRKNSLVFSSLVKLKYSLPCHFVECNSLKMLSFFLSPRRHQMVWHRRHS